MLKPKYLLLNSGLGSFNSLHDLIQVIIVVRREVRLIMLVLLTVLVDIQAREFLSQFPIVTILHPLLLQSVITPPKKPKQKKKTIGNQNHTPKSITKYHEPTQIPRVTSKSKGEG